MHISIELIYFAICSVVSGTIFGLAAYWYAMPRLIKQDARDAVIPLLLVSAFRVTGLFFLIPGLVSPQMPSQFAVPTAVGDATAAMLALIAAILLRRRSSLGVAVAWAYGVVGSIDLMNAFLQTQLRGVEPAHFGTTVFLSAVNVPMLMVVHVMMFQLLIRHASSARVGKAVPVG